ncbi:MAG: mycofactocin biosynthesis chaperone MftB [Ilumatobacter sp.]
MTVEAATAPLAQRALELHPRVALRPEPFGALAYHYDTRRLVFLKHPDVVRVVRALADHATVAGALDACGIDAARHDAFEQALISLIESEMLHDRAR